MKLVMTLLGVMLLSLASISEAHAVVCARGVWRAGCAGPNGAVVVPRRPPVVVVPAYGRRYPSYHRHCYWRGGVRVCR